MVTTKKLDRRTEIDAQILYFSRMIPALEGTIKQMQIDLELCKKNLKVWEHRKEVEVER